jgi:murein L,D-transpeptidase YcbB/YkuD
MRANIRSMLLFATTACLPVGLAAAQVAPAPAPTGQATPAPAPQAAPTPQGAPPAVVVPAPPPAPVVLPPLIWQISDVQQLLAVIRSIGAEGLDPRDYDPEGLIKTMQTGDPMAISAAATDRFNLVSYDLALGHVRGKDRIGWHVVDPDLDVATQRQMLEVALATHRIAPVLQTLLPTHPQYGALKTALTVAKPTDTALVNRIKLNMDRWRWLPRDLGQKYIIVNVPAFHATLVENGVTRWKHRAIAGAIKTPTPQLNVMATGVILNPWWEVPPSITKEVAGKPGYVALKGEDGKVKRWRQPPGPNNALGQLKFVMYNPYNIYLHDTNARSRFNAQSAGRALSHGCVRTEHVLDLATQLLSDDGGEWTPEKIAETLASKKMKQANFVKPVPVYIVYFSAAALTDGTIINYSDLYKRDAKVIAALLDRDVAPTVKPASQVATK